MSNHIRITDVAPRDGLQNEPRVIPTAEKARLIQALGRTGVDEIEITSFVSPKWIPQLGDAAELCVLLAGNKPRDVLYSALVPNEKGMQSAIAADEKAGGTLLDKVAVFTAASETFSQRNTNATIAETFERFGPVLDLAEGQGFAVRGYVSCIVKCPFEGFIPAARVAEIVAKLWDLGVDEVYLGETSGAGTPANIIPVLSAVTDVMGRENRDRITLHLHDTTGQASACVKAALDFGIRSFDSAAGGLGGCPYASTPQHRAPGNIATETLVEAIVAAGQRTRIQPGLLREASGLARALIE